MPYALFRTAAVLLLASCLASAAAGATVNMPAEDMFWGDRYGQVTDPFGHVWSFGTPSKK